MVRCALQIQKKPEKTKDMSILFERERGTLTLLTDHTAYQMQIGPEGYLLHTYYGRACDEDFRYLHLERDCGFSPNPYALSASRGFSLDTMPQEYSGSNGADFRLPCILSDNDDGILGVDLRYVRHEIREGAYALEGLPTAFDDANEETETLSVICTGCFRIGMLSPGRSGSAIAAEMPSGSERLPLPASICPSAPGTASVFTDGMPWSGSRRGVPFPTESSASLRREGIPAISTIPLLFSVIMRPMRITVSATG